MPTFADPARESELLEAGFVVAPLLDAAEVAHLRDAYRSLVPPGDHGLTIDYMRPDRAAMREIAALVAPVWARRFPELFEDHEPVFSTFVTKHPGEASTMFLHEDRTFVDERLARAGTLWVPLVDTGPELGNGGLEVIPGSHRLCETWSGTDTPELFRPYETWLRERLVPVSVPAGHCLFYDTRTLHASAPNLAEASREVLVCAVAPRTAPWVHVVATGRRHRRLHRVDRDFYLDVHPHAVSAGLDEARYPVIEELDDDRRLDGATVAAVLGGPGAPPAPNDGWAAAAAAGLEPSPRRLAHLTADPAVAVHELQAGAVSGGDPLVEVAAGSGGVVRALPGTLPAWLGASDEVLDGDRGGWCLVLDAGSEASIELPTGEGGWWLDLVDVAPAGATLRHGPHEVLLDEDVALRLPSGSSATIEHRGPGQLVVLLSARRARGDVAPGARTASSGVVDEPRRGVRDRLRAALGR